MRYPRQWNETLGASGRKGDGSAKASLVGMLAASAAPRVLGRKKESAGTCSAQHVGNLGLFLQLRCWRTVRSHHNDERARSSQQQAHGVARLGFALTLCD